MQPGTQLGHYEILSPLGKGGMGEVWRARDATLGRDVAIKMLPEAVANDEDWLARFEREAKLLASLNHPNIASIYGLEKDQGVLFLVLELVEGETLAEFLQEGALPLEFALRIAAQVADALEAAHHKGIVHRDLKPANIKVTPNGRVKVLDFGLAKAVVTDGESASRITTHVTDSGLIVGTAAYMSPEQLRGQHIDKRSDVWAFGCVLFEMVAGRMVFGEETMSDVIARIIQGEPDWNLLPTAVPRKIQTLIEHCLRKDSHRRLHDIADARIDIEDLMEGVTTRGSTLAEEAPLDIPTGWRAAARWTLVAVLAVALVAVLLSRGPSGETDGLTARFEFPTEAGAPLHLSVSPDGRQIAYVATFEGQERIWIRSMDSIESRVLADTADAAYPFWSPDGTAIGFLANSRLKRIAATGGPAQTLADAPLEGGGGDWSEDGTILFMPEVGGLYRIPADGSSPATPLTSLDRELGHVYHAYPEFLPDGERFLFFAASGQRAGQGIYVGSLGTGEFSRVTYSEFLAMYAPPGYLLSVEDGNLMAQAFDAGLALATGTPVSIAEGIATNPRIGNAGFSVSLTGVLAYRRRAVSNLVWFDSTGQKVQQVGDGRSPWVMPRGTQVIAERTDRSQGDQGDIVLIDPETGINTRFTFDEATDRYPVASPDGSEIVFASDRTGYDDLYIKPTTAAGDGEPLLQSEESKQPTDWSRDGQFVLYTNLSSTTSRDIWVLPRSGDTAPSPFLQTVFEERHGRFSPDGRWVAYTCDESGRFEVYVQSFPSMGNKRQISAAGGQQPRWSDDGSRLFYLAPDRTLMSVDLTIGSSVESSTPRPLFVAPISLASDRYAVSGDGERFLMPTVAGGTGVPPITVITGWSIGLEP